MERNIFKNLRLFFNDNYKFLPKFARIVPAIIYYLHFCVDITGFNRIAAKFRHRNEIVKIPEDTKIVFFENGSMHHHLSKFYSTIPNSYLITMNHKFVSPRYRSEFMEFILRFDFSNTEYIQIQTLEHLTYAGKGVMEKFRKLPQKKFAMAHLFMPVDEIIFLSQYFNFLFVLSKSQVDYLNSFGISNVLHLEHPITLDGINIKTKEVLRNKNNIPQDIIVFSSAGNMRYDKGFHLLADALELLDNGDKEKIFINLLGVVKDDITLKAIGKIESLGIPCKIDVRNELISFEELKENIALSDYYLLTYVRQFSNGSAQLIDAIGCGIPVIASDYVPLGNDVRDNNLGFTFEKDNIYELAELLRKIINKQVVAPIISPDYIKSIQPVSVMEKLLTYYEI